MLRLLFCKVLQTVFGLVLRNINNETFVRDRKKVTGRSKTILIRNQVQTMSTMNGYSGERPPRSGKMLCKNLMTICDKPQFQPPSSLRGPSGPWQSIRPFRLLCRFGEPTCRLDCHGASPLAMTKVTQLRFFMDHKQLPKTAGGTITNRARND